VRRARASRRCSLSLVTDAIAHWHSLLRPEVELTPSYAEAFTTELRGRHLNFGDRIHCPFLRPFFLDEEQVALVRRVSETIARMGETLVAASAARAELFDALAVTEADRALVAIDPGYGTSSTASRLDSFILPGSLQFAEYNAESPAGLGYTDTLVGVFDTLAITKRFRERYDARALTLMGQMLDALLASYREWGGTANPPMIAIVDFRGVPTWAEFEMLQARFIELGVPTVVCEPQDLVFDGTSLSLDGRHIDLVYRRCLVNDIVDRPDDCRALVDAYAARAVCVANTLRCKLPHKKAFFAVLTDARFADLFDASDRAAIAPHVPWTRLVREGRTERHGESIDLIPYVRAHRADLVMKPNDDFGGHGVILGWEADEATWDTTLARALSGQDDAWVVQEKIHVRRELFPRFKPGEGAVIGDMLVDCAPYLFRGKLAGFLTRLSAGGLANVTSGGGQVPSYIVRAKVS
jgi:uncharacterized circularly permuted ATP-grasp superfamily protein